MKPAKDMEQLRGSMFVEWLDTVLAILDKEKEDTELFDSRMEPLLGRKYGKVTPEEVISKQKYLTSTQCDQLKHVLECNTDLFDGKLGHYLHKKFDIPLIENAKPVWQKPFPIPF